ncbi:MAG: hypothetical protein IID55_03660 [Proteobacteria bacterium]|nr:hypothetical protein [Pseudomonadota bacterium]
MIAQKFVDFVQGPTMHHVGSRNVKLRPAYSWAFGATVNADEGTITFYLPNVEGAETLGNFEDNGMVAFTVGDPATNETYQFKGPSLSIRPSEDKDTAIQDIHRSKLISHLGPLGYPDAILTGFTIYPSTAVTFKVEDVFVQTPGPGAGAKLDLESSEPVGGT